MVVLQLAKFNVVVLGFIMQKVENSVARRRAVMRNVS